ncbi:MAG: hypothetical protein O7B81_03605, partial [Gammaproteobacteria bacterium]|nr:hypothetical protein [Gammaproteobacteria bacterium]
MLHMASPKRMGLWLTLLMFSSVIHAIVSWQVGRQIEPLAPLPIPDEEPQIVINAPPEPLLEKPPPPEDQLEFEEDLELDPPEILIAPKAVAPPPP